MWLSRFVEECKGGVAPLFGLAIIPIIGSVGVAVDFSRANAAKAAMQSALDSSALMLAKDALQASGSGLSGTDYFNANFARPEVQNVNVTAATSPSSGGVSVTASATGSVQSDFLQLMGFPTLDIAVHTNVTASADGRGCVLSLSKTADGAVTGQGSIAVNLNGCSLYDNSKSTTALTVGGSASVSAYSVGVVGGVSGNANITTTEGIKKISEVSDPYANDAFPAFYACDYQNYSAHSTVTINPGVYCGGIGTNANAVVTMNPGIYYIDGGSLTVNGGASINGTGVTLVFTKRNSSSWPTVSINGNATVYLEPPRSGPTAGILVFGDRNIPLGTTFRFNGGVNQDLRGAIYVPTGAIEFSGGSGTSTSCTQIIGNTVTFTGNAGVAVDCARYGTKPISAPAIRVTS